MNLSKIKEAVKTHKLLTGFFFLLALVVLVWLTNSFFATRTTMPGRAPMSYEFDPGEVSRSEMPANGVSGILDVREGQMTIKSEEAESEAEMIRSLADQYGGYIQESRKQEWSTALKITSVVRVPIDRFDNFISDIQERFQVENYDLRNFRIDVRHQIDELSIIQATLEDYAQIRQEALQMGISEQKVRLLMDITEKELELVARQRNFERTLTDRERQADMAVLTVVLEQKIRADLWPQDLGNCFRDRLNRAIDTAVLALTSILTNGLVLAARLIEYLIYAFIIVVPFSLGWRWLKKIYRRFNKNS